MVSASDDQALSDFLCHAVIKDGSTHFSGAWKANPQSFPLSHLNTHPLSLTHTHTAFHSAYTNKIKPQSTQESCPLHITVSDQMTWFWSRGENETKQKKINHHCSYSLALTNTKVSVKVVLIIHLQIVRGKWVKTWKILYRRKWRRQTWRQKWWDGWGLLGKNFKDKSLMSPGIAERQGDGINSIKNLKIDPLVGPLQTSLKHGW